MSASFQAVPIERIQEYWNRRPCNIRHSPAWVGTREYFDQVETRKYFVEPHIPRFADFANWKGKKVLEIGCGIGTDTVSFARNGATVTAVDLSEKSLELARKRVEVYGLEDRVRFFQGSAEELSAFVPVEPYELIYSFGMIHHTPHPERVIEQMKHYAAPGTTIKMMVYHRNSWKAFWIVMKYGKGRFWGMKELIARHSEAETGCPVTYAYSRREARQLLERAGFSVKEMTVDHIFPYRIADYVRYRYEKCWCWRWVPQTLFRAMERVFGWHLLIHFKWGG